MLKEHAKVFTRLLAFFDLFLIAFGFYLSSLIKKVSFSSEYILFLLFILFIEEFLLWHFGVYTSFRIKTIPQVLFSVIKASFITLVISGFITYIFKLQSIGRGFMVLVFGVITLLLSAEKIILIKFFRFIRKKGFNYRNILLIGTGKRAQRFIDLVHQHAEWGLRIVGLVDYDEAKKGKIVKGYKVLGSFKDIPDIIHNNVIDEVVFVVPRSQLNEIEDIIYFCEEEGLKVNIAVDLFELKISKAKQTALSEMPLITFESTPDKIWALLIKRIIDISVSGVALILLSPLFLIISILIKLTSKGPVFFKQVRVGLNGRRFILYKFRTMVEDAEERLKSLLKYNEMKGPVFKMSNDPRITKIGKILRRFSLDELPQLWNVLKGDMSLVGPRPPLPSEVEKYQPWQRRRLSMRPGLTCLWQVNGRNKINDFDEWVRLDLEYIDNWSLGLDFKILFKTVPVVLLGIGAK